MTQQYKKGDRVKVVRGEYYITKVGTTGTVEDDYDSNRVWVRSDVNGNRYDLPKDHLAILVKTLDTLAEGDVVKSESAFSPDQTVIHVLKPGLYILEGSDEDTVLYSAKELASNGYAPVQEPQDDTVRLTVAEAAKKLGIDPDKLHIISEKDAA